MADFGFWTGHTTSEESGASVANSRIDGAALTAPGTINTRSTATTLSAGLTYPASAFMLTLNYASGTTAQTTSSFLFNLLVGGQRLLPNIGFGMGLTNREKTSYILLPMALPSGQTIAMDYQCSQVTDTGDWYAQIHAFPSSYGTTPRYNGYCTSYGATEASSLSTTVDPGGTLNTKGAWVALSTSTNAGHGLFLIISTPPTDGGGNSQRWLVDVGLSFDAGSSWNIIMPNLFYDAQQLTHDGRFYHLPISIPSGVQLGMRCSCSNNTVGQRELNATAIGLT